MFTLSEFIGFHIDLYVERSKKEVADSEEFEEVKKEEEGNEGDEPKIEDVVEEKEKGELTKKTKKMEVSHMPVVFNDRCLVSECRKLKVPQLPMSLLAQFIDCLDVPVIMQRRLRQ